MGADAEPALSDGDVDALLPEPCDNGVRVGPAGGETDDAGPFLLSTRADHAAVEPLQAIDKFLRDIAQPPVEGLLPDGRELRVHERVALAIAKEEAENGK